MVDEQEPAKRVVKRVVKKTVVRPATPAEPKPQLRYGRPVATTSKPQAKVASKPGTAVQSRPVAKAKAKTSPVPRPKAPRPSVDVGARLGAAGHRIGDVWWSVTDAVGGGARTAGRATVARARSIAAYRLPHINLYLASVITGAVVGIVAVVLGAISLSIFQDLRGVSGGGGTWGSLAFIGVAIICYALGALLLKGFGSTAGKLTSFLGVVLAIVTMLGLFLGLVDSIAAVVLVPLLSVATYAVAHWLIDLAEHTPAVVD